MQSTTGKVIAMASTASLKASSRTGLRSVPSFSEVAIALERSASPVSRSVFKPLA